METLEQSITYAKALSPAQWCQAFYVLSSAGILALQLLPSDVRKALMDYGARRPKDESRSEKQTDEERSENFLVRLTSYGEVPHSWFYHYYVASVVWSALWVLQYVLRGSVMKTVAEMQSGSADESSVELGRTVVASVMMGLQGARRLYECFHISKPGSSPMWAPHWLLGLVFYTAMNLSIWIQGSDAILQAWKSPQEATVDIVSPRMLFGVLIFTLAGVNQHRCHKYLASLKKYTLPGELLFQHIICPHYTWECLIYLSIAFTTAPPGDLFNRTVLCGLIFVVVNLGSTALGTKQWYASKFGADKVAGKWKMIPFIF